MGCGGHVVVNPHALGEQRVGAGDVDSHGAGRCVYADDRFDLLLVHVLVDKEIARLDELGGREAPFVAAADHERVLRRRLQAPVDDHEAVVLAEADAGHAGGDGRRAVKAVMREPVVLGAVRDIDLEAGHLDGCHSVAGLEVLDGRKAAVLEAHKRAEEEAVAAGAGTRPAAARTRAAGTGPTWAGAPAARTTATGRSSTRGAAAG